MTDFPASRGLDHGEAVLSTSSSLCPGLISATPAAAAWPTTNLAIFVPIRVARQVTAYKMVFGCGTTAGGNADVGIYDSAGIRLVSSGAQARVASSEVVADITDTTFGPGRFYLAMAVDGTSNIMVDTPSGTSPVPLQKTRLMGVLQMATAYTLPNPATFAAATNAPIPMVAAYLRPY